MKEEEFKNWLQEGGAQSEKARNTRVYAVKTIERKLEELGLQSADLDEAWAEDRFEALRERLNQMRQDALEGGQDYRILMPQSEKPGNRLSNWHRWLGQYGKFLSGDVPRSAKDADRIRQHVLENYIEKARDDGREMVEVLVSDVNRDLGLNQAWRNICQALAGKKFLELAKVAPPERIGADQSSATVFQFNTDIIEGEQGHSSDKPFVLFDALDNPYQPVKHFNRTNGLSAYRIQPTGVSNSADEAIEINSIEEVARAMLVDSLPARIQAISGGPVNYLTYGNQKLVRYELDPEIAVAIGVPPNGSVSSEGRVSSAPNPSPNTDHPMTPINLILYGPPGTGKTYATAAEAVRLCGEEVPTDRVDLMATYNRLSEAKRIEFVTFHQSMSYEDFVEGKQPVTGGDDETDSAGFRLETVPGIFRRISRRAETSRGQASKGDAISTKGRQIFKMSIGEAANPEDAHLFEEAISGGYTLLGYGDIDWSDKKYADRKAIIAAQEHDNEGEKFNSHSGHVQMPFIFRNWVRLGDLVIVSKGNSQFRAIGEFTGEYEFHPRPEGGYAHRRAVRWLWVDRAGVPVSEIYSRSFSMKSIYVMYDNEIDIPALERYMNSQTAPNSANPEPFVLIIDEINRANISKVFGELITLLEPDKRLGALNQVKVRLPYSGDEFGVPSNLHILGTMNTADRSIALLDTALRRRFEFLELMPDPSLLRDAAELCGKDLPAMLATLNERIEYLYDREHKIGHAYFLNCSSAADVDAVMRHSVIPLLTEYFFEDWTKVAAVLGDTASHDGEIKGGFLKRSVLKPPPGLDGDGDTLPCFRWTLRSEEEGFDYGKLIGE